MPSFSISFLRMFCNTFRFVASRCSWWRGDLFDVIRTLIGVGVEVDMRFCVGNVREVVFGCCGLWVVGLGFAPSFG
ncbi:hypothetical protein Lser_V15G29387 [Lactuca serriola]